MNTVVVVVAATAAAVIGYRLSPFCMAESVSPCTSFIQCHCNTLSPYLLLFTVPSAQRYGILFGFVVFITTVTAVVALLVLGGSFQRMAQQAETGEATLLAPHDARAQRALLFERLLESRERMAQAYPAQQRTEGPTGLTNMLLNEKWTTDAVNETKSSHSQEMRQLYQHNYTKAYRKCQDYPGGNLIVCII